MIESHLFLIVQSTVEPLYNEDLGTMKITMLHVYQVFRYIRVKKQRNV